MGASHALKFSDFNFAFCILHSAFCILHSPMTGFLDRPTHVVYLSREYDPTRPWPTILFLHGSGERGGDAMRATKIGVGSAIREDRSLVPAIVVFPIAPEQTRWLGAEAAAAMAALDATLAEFSVDRERVYLTGLSMGGYGAIHLALAHPDRFAALVIVCGGMLPHPTTTAVQRSPLIPDDQDPYAFAGRTLARTPVWLFHGADDPVIPVAESRRLAKALPNARYTEYAGVGHNAWEKAYADREMWSWLFAQRLSGR